jgi:pimeloyl-ACP methyl ester carboxylesterase
MQEKVSFRSGEYKLSGILHRPTDGASKKPKPAFLVMHGFGSNKDGGFAKVAATLLADLGYIVMRFDMRGCGESEGPRGRVICVEQVEDTGNAITFLESLDGVDATKIGLMGHSFGAAVAVYTAAIDKRVAACISSGGWGDGEKKFRAQHSDPAAWSRFSSMLEQGRAMRARGEQLMVSRFDIVPIAPELRGNLSPGSIMEFPFDVVESMYTFRANDVVAKISPRPLLLIHPSVDSVTPTEQSLDLFRFAGQPTDLHLFAKVDHFLFSEENPVVVQLVRAWLDKFIPSSDSLS